MTRCASCPATGPAPGWGGGVLIRADAAGCPRDVLDWLAGQRLSYSVGFTLPEDTERLLRRIPTSVWAPAYDADGDVRDGAWVAEFTGLLDLSGWPAGMRVIVRTKRPHPGAQLRITDPGRDAGDRAHQTPAPRRAATDHRPGRDAGHRLRHQTPPASSSPTWSCGTAAGPAPRTACCAKDTGLTNLPLHDFDQNRIWCAIVALACELPRGCRCSPWPVIRPAGGSGNGCGCGCSPRASHLAVSGRRVVLHLARTNHWGGRLVAMLARLRALPALRRLIAGSHVPTTPATPARGPAHTERHRATCHTPGGRITQHSAPDTAGQAASADSRKIRANVTTAS